MSNRDQFVFSIAIEVGDQQHFDRVRVGETSQSCVYDGKRRILAAKSERALVENAKLLRVRPRLLHRLLLRKYYVDEIYDAALVQPIRIVSEQALWKGVDVGLIDGAVNGAGVTVRGASGWLRLLQTGSIRAYAASLMVGTLLILGYLLWPR